MGTAIEMDGSLGEGGGQLLRTSLALAAITDKPVTIKNVRSKRPKPGLRPQHLAAVKTIASICNASLEGARIGSTSLSFKAGQISKTSLNVNIGTAGSISLLLSQVLPVSLLQEVSLHVTGGTNVPFSPPIEFLQEALFPVLRKAGAKLELNVNRRGYFPRGNGLATFSSKKAMLPLRPIKLAELGALKFVRIYSHCASLPRKVALNQASAAKHELRALNLEFEEKIECREQADTIGSGISLFAHTSSGAILSGSALGARGKPAEQAGKEAAQNLLEELASKQPCDSHLADQLVPFMALAKGKSEIHCAKLSQHCLTNISAVEKFLPAKFLVQGKEGASAVIAVDGCAFSGKQQS